MGKTVLESIAMRGHFSAWIKHNIISSKDADKSLKDKIMNFRNSAESYTYIGITWILTIMVYILKSKEFDGYEPFVGSANYLLISMMIYVLGYLFLIIFRENVVSDSLATLESFHVPFVLGMLFSSITILIDYTIGFGDDINVGIGDGLLFYPAIAMIVEIVFHLLPMTILYSVILKLTNNGRETALLIGTLCIASFEPTFQLIFTSFDNFSTWMVVVFWIHLFLFNLFQLRMFKKFSFNHMYIMRIGYYILWHILWEIIR
ncbi:MAG: hypothetical protein INQ03_02675 [Candidatus Heimdallarchaeota archaeon]|nr:hypothetical protein [Candidatus Heimdallarchaeota archaeon]